MDSARTDELTPKEAALQLAAAGYSVLPVNLRRDAKRPKQPFVNWSEFQSRIPSPDEIEGWWSRWPDAGVAIVTGKVSGVAVADVDPRNAGRVEAWEDVSDVAQRTLSGGAHFFTAYTTELGSTKLPGTDIKSDGGYVVVAPSRAEDGRAYAWRGDAFERLLRRELPDASVLVQRITDTQAAGRGGAAEYEARDPWIADAIKQPEACAAGGQEETLTKLCWWASKALPYDIALALLAGWAAQLPLGNLHDPWTEQHVRDRLDRAMEKRALEPPVFNASLEGSADEPTGATETRAERIARLAGKCRSAKEWAATAHESVPWAVDRLVAFGTLTDLHSPPKAGKSTLLAHIVRGLVDGSEVIGRRAEQTPVVWVTEQPRASFETEVLQGAGLRDHPELFLLYFHDLLEAPWDERAAATFEAARRHGARVVIFDTFPELAAIEGEQENQAGAMLKALKALTPALAEGLAVLIVRHDRKNGGGGAVSGGRGSSAIPGKADVLFQLTPAGGQYGPNVRRLTYQGRFGAIPSEVLIELTGEGYRALGTRSELGLQRAREEQFSEWALLAGAAPSHRSERLSASKLIASLQGPNKLGRDKARSRLDEYRRAVEEWGMDPDGGMLLWDAGEVNPAYWRACSCRLAVEACGACSACRTGAACEHFNLRLQVDPLCDGDHGFLTDCSTGVQEGQEAVVRCASPLEKENRSQSREAPGEARASWGSWNTRGQEVRKPLATSRRRARRAEGRV